MKIKPYRTIHIVAILIAAVCMTVFGTPVPAPAGEGDKMTVGHFSAAVPGENPPEGWEPLYFKKIASHTRYTVVETDDSLAVKAESNASASGLIRKIRIDPAEYPIVTWRWKVENILQKGDVYKKEGDDYSARLYITFEYDPSRLSFSDRIKYKTVRLLYGEYPPTGAINYIWGNRASVGTITPNPFVDRAMMIVVESGKEKLKQWVTEKRNILEDYRNAFGSDPPAISGVAVMTDTDNTGESAVAFFGDIAFEKF
jgi:hypothetical protein